MEKIGENDFCIVKLIMNYIVYDKTNNLTKDIYIKILLDKKKKGFKYKYNIANKNYCIQGTSTFTIFIINILKI